MRILCGWEFGAGLGHVTRLKPIATAFRDRGAEVVIALQDLDRASAFLDAETGIALPGFHVVAGPRWLMPHNPEARKIPTHSFADVLNIIKYGNAEALAVRIEAWAGLLRTAKPDLVIGDFCPTLRLAARGRVPIAMVGNGYTIPPSGRPLPPIRPWQKKLEPFSVEHEARLLETINVVLAQRGDPPLAFLADALNGDETFVFSIPLVDPYAAYRGEAQLPPFNLPTGMRPLAMEKRRTKGVFFYMPRSHPDLRRAIDAVKAASVDCEAYISDLSPDQAARLTGPGFTVHDDPQPFDRVIPEARLVVHHGGLSTAVAAILAGTPQLIFPWNLEHLVTAKQIESLGASVTAAADWPVKKIAAGLRQMVNDKPFAIRAAKAVDAIQIGDAAETLDDVMRRCVALAEKPVA
jgi:UDP:flavonoid glycosyltransferase YjiC (YdhE family)